MSVHILPHLESANASFVTPRLLVGGDLSSDRDRAADQLHELVAAGVTHIIDVRIEATDERFVAEAASSLSYRHHGVDDRGQRIPGRWFQEGTTYILRALADPQAIVLAHCHMGINRGPSIGFAALLALGWDCVDALDAIRTARPIAYVDYAEDALAWHHARTSAPKWSRAADLTRVAAWRSHNRLNVHAVIRGIRSADIR